MTNRRSPREVPPERKTMGVAGISIVFDMSGYSCGQYGSVVFPAQMNVTVTEDALSQMSTICDKNNVPVVRFELKGGGCGGLMSTWETEPHYEPAQGDLTWSLGDDRVFVVDEFTASFCDGGTINYDITTFMPAFSISVPGKGSCGCGESFVA